MPRVDEDTRPQVLKLASGLLPTGRRRASRSRNLLKRSSTGFTILVVPTLYYLFAREQ